MIDLTDPCRRWPPLIARLPRLVRLFLVNGLIGFLLSGVFTTLVLVTDTAGLGHLVLSVEGGWLAGVMFFAFNGIVFAGVQTGIVVMMMDDTPD